jgi:hypothetical protein
MAVSGSREWMIRIALPFAKAIVVHCSHQSHIPQIPPTWAVPLHVGVFPSTICGNQQSGNEGRMIAMTHEKYTLIRRGSCCR